MTEALGTQTSLDAIQWVQLLGLGGLVGALGQGARTIVGLKKLSDSAAKQDRSTNDLLEVGRLMTSLAIGFIAGALAAIPLLGDLSKISSGQIFTLAASGYAGADFIEGFISKIPGQQSSTTSTNATSATLANAAADGAVG